MTAAEIIQALGGKAKVADATGRDRNTVLYWERRGRIPSACWHVLADLAKQAGDSKVNLEVLAKHQPSPARTAA